LETFHGAPNVIAIPTVWPYLKNNDRFIRYAARIAIEHQPISQWQEKAFLEYDPQILTQAMIAMARIRRQKSTIEDDQEVTLWTLNSSYYLNLSK
jgi:hypothetical protein